MNRFAGFILPVGICLMTLCTIVAAQPEPGGPGGPGGKRPPRERMEQFRKMRLIEYLNLDEETSARFIARYNKHEEDMHALFTQRGEAIDALDEAVKGSRENEYQSLLNNVLTIDRKIADTRIQFLSGLDDILTKKQQAKVLIFDRDFNRDVREMIMDTRRGAH